MTAFTQETVPTEQNQTFEVSNISTLENELSNMQGNLNGMLNYYLAVRSYCKKLISAKVNFFFTEI